MHPTRVLRTVLNLATQLRVSGAVLLIGPPGVGKTLAWRALVAAVSGEVRFVLVQLALLNHLVCYLQNSGLACIGGCCVWRGVYSR